MIPGHYDSQKLYDAPRTRPKHTMNISIKTYRPITANYLIINLEESKGAIFASKHLYCCLTPLKSISLTVYNTTF